MNSLKHEQKRRLCGFFLSMFRKTFNVFPKWIRISELSIASVANSGLAGQFYEPLGSEDLLEILDTNENELGMN